MIRTAVALSAVACITSLTALVNERQVRPPISSCEAQLARLTVQPWEGKGTLPAEFPLPPTEEEILVTQDATLFPDR